MEPTTEAGAEPEMVSLAQAGSGDAGDTIPSADGVGNTEEVVDNCEQPMETLTIETKPNIAVGDLLTTRDLQILFGVTRRTIENWRGRGLIKSVKIGGCIRYRREDVNTIGA